jgi:hypothetical protein
MGREIMEIETGRKIEMVREIMEIETDRKKEMGSEMMKIETGRKLEIPYILLYVWRSKVWGWKTRLRTTLADFFIQ